MQKKCQHVFTEIFTFQHGSDCHRLTSNINIDGEHLAIGALKFNSWHYLRREKKITITSKHKVLSLSLFVESNLHMTHIDFTNFLKMNSKVSVRTSFLMHIYRNGLDYFLKIRQIKVLIRLFCWNKDFHNMTIDCFKGITMNYEQSYVILLVK